MNLILSWIMFLLTLKYTKRTYRAFALAYYAGYDFDVRYQRANEEMGLCILGDWSHSLLHRSNFFLFGSLLSKLRGGMINLGINYLRAAHYTEDKICDFVLKVLADYHNPEKGVMNEILRESKLSV